MSSVRKEIVSLVFEVQESLKQGKCADESICNALEELKTLLPGSTLPTPSSEILRNHHQEATNLFTSEYYVSLSEHLIESFSPEWLHGGSYGRRLHKLCCEFFLEGDPEIALTVLCYAVSSTKESLKVYGCISLLESLFKQNCLRRIFSDYCSLRSSEKSDGDTERMLVEKSVPLVSAVSSLPDLVTSRLTSRDDSGFFYPQNYIPFVGLEMVSVLRMVYTRLRDGQSCSVSVLSAVLGKLAITGHGKLLWISILKELESICVGDFLWQRVLQKMVSGVTDRCLEQVTTPLIVLSSSPRTVTAVLGELPVIRERLRYTLTHKLLLVRYVDQPQMLRNVIGYLASLDSLRTMFLDAFTKLLNAWRDGSSLRHRPLEQTIYISKAIMIFVAYLSRDACIVTRDLKDVVMETLMGGMGNYLDSSVVQVRQMGMVVGESLSGLVHSDDKRLAFEVEGNELVDGLRALLLIPEDHQPSHHEDQTGNDSESASRNAEQPNGNDSENAAGKVGTDKSVKSPNESDALDSDDDEEELIPYSSDLKSSSKPVKRPVYLAQCMDGLLKSDDPEWFEQCLQHAEELIRKHPEVSEMAVEMCKVILNLEDPYSLDGFVLLRHKAMVALVVSCPESTARYLTHEFYERNYNIRQRLDILDVLSSAARELSQPLASTDKIDSHHSGVGSKTKPASTDKIDSRPSSVGSKTKPDGTHWSGIVEARIESNTRRFGKGATRPAPTPIPSRFAKVSGWFFYPLMSQFDKRESCLDLLGCDHILLQRLLGTLGCVMFSAANAPNISPMARALIEFTWCFRYHVQPGVRRAVLGAVLMMIVAHPPFLLTSDLCSEVADLREWMQEEVLPRDSDGECRSLAAQVLVTLQTRLKQELQDTSDN